MDNPCRSELPSSQENKDGVPTTINIAYEGHGVPTALNIAYGGIKLEAGNIADDDYELVTDPALCEYILLYQISTLVHTL